MAEDGYRLTAVAIFVGAELATEQRWNAHHTEIPGGHTSLNHVCGTISGDEVDARSAEPSTARGRVDHLRVVVDGQVGATVNRVARALPARRPHERDDRREAVGLRIRQGLEQERVHDAEDGGVDADPDSQRHERDQRESRRLAEHPGGIPEIAENRVEHEPQYSRAAGRGSRAAGHGLRGTRGGPAADHAEGANDGPRITRKRGTSA